MNIPNILTMLRFVMTLGFLYLFPINILASAILFVLAAVTDFFDGYLARKYDLITPFGKIMDPIADKFLVLSAFWVFYHFKMIWGWVFWPIAIREVGVTLFRFWAMSKGKVLAAEKMGKLKTVIQMAAIIMMLISIIFFPAVLFGRQCINMKYASDFFINLLAFDFVLLFLSVIITLFSGILVIWNNQKLFSS